ncbi:MAG: YbbR-like domain-containing protein [Bacteriovoracaceae bacterium]|jgi:YbbR domain-containing protein|nr:YbbR-like domain-containing protein [Bacteriovoracaceae bacterium]
MRSKIQQKQISNHTLKLISLFFAITLWFYVLNSAPIIIEKKIPLNLKLPKGMAISNIVDQEITVKLKGSRVFMRNIFNQNTFIFINLKKYIISKSKKEIDLKLGPADIPVPFGVEVLDISPKNLNLKLEKLVKKTVKIVPTLVGEVGQEFKMIKESLVPSKLEIEGPKSIVKAIKSISTTAIDISALQKSGELKVAAIDIDSRLSIVTKEPIYFQYEIRARKANITLKNVKIRFLSSAKKISSKTRVVSMDVLIPEGEDQSIRPSQVKVIADVPDGSKGKIEVALRAKLPEGVFLLKINPKKINLFVKP